MTLKQLSQSVALCLLISLSIVSYKGIFEHRLPTVQMMQTQALIGFIIWRVGGLMLIGMALMKLGILSGERSKAFYRKMLLIGYGLGLPIVLYSAWSLQAHQ